MPDPSTGFPVPLEPRQIKTKPKPKPKDQTVNAGCCGTKGKKN